MALRKRQAASSHADVPEPLTTRLHPLWSDPDAIRRFCDDEGLYVRALQGPLDAFDVVAKGFAVAQGWVVTYGNNPREFPHYAALNDHGIPMFSCGLLARERHGTGEVLTPADWQFIKEAEDAGLEATRRQT